MAASDRFVVYIIRDPRKDDEPIYVGKGSRDRRAKTHLSQNAHNRFLTNIIQKIRKDGMEPIVDIAFRFKTEQEAFEKEKELIALFGRRSDGTGSLTNITSGGEGVSGVKYSEEMLALKREVVSKLGKRPDVIAKKSLKTKENWQDPTIRQKRSLGISKALNRLEYKQNKSKETAAFWKDPQHSLKRRLAISESRRKFNWIVNSVAHPTAEEAAKNNGVTTATILNWVKNGKAKKEPIREVSA